VLHNGLYDICLLYQYFFYDLPTYFDQFKNQISKVFSQIYDTKHILSLKNKNDTNLQTIYQTIEANYDHIKIGNSVDLKKSEFH